MRDTGGLADERVTALSVVEDLNAIAEIALGRHAHGLVGIKDLLALQAVEEIFRRRIVPAIAFTAHR